MHGRDAPSWDNKKVGCQITTKSDSVDFKLIEACQRDLSDELEGQIVTKAQRDLSDGQRDLSDAATGLE